MRLALALVLVRLACTDPQCVYWPSESLTGPINPPSPPPSHPPTPPPRDYKTWTTIKEQYGPFEVARSTQLMNLTQSNITYDPPPVDLGTNLDVNFVYEVC